MSEVLVLDVMLAGLKVGALRYERESVSFRLDDEYIDSPNRPVLGQVFEDDPRKAHRVRSGLPPWFSNLLPEGPLRGLIARKVGVHPSRDFFLLAHLGDDLPGAVRVAACEPPDLADFDAADDDDAPPPRGEPSDFDFKFSLAGVQLKFSVLSDESGVTLPIFGADGDFIAKLPDERHDGVPENEFSMMTWARESGIAVPEFSLVDVERIAGLPSEVVQPGKRAFVIRRFDRDGGRAVHIEDFAQVLNRLPTAEGKYGGANYETLARILLALNGIEDVREYVRRLVAMVAMGNGDAHLKNWSLIYPDGRAAKLSPAYDLVSTFTYVRTEESLALNLAGSKAFEDADLGSFRRMSRKLGLAYEKDLDDTVREAAEGLRSSWHSFRTELPLADAVRHAIDERVRDLPLMQI